MLKFLCIFLLPLVSFAEVRNTKAVKTLDGKGAHCREERNVGIGAYRPTNFNVSAAGEVISVTLNVAAILCVKTGDTYHWVARGFREPIYKKAMDGTPVSILYSNLEFRLTGSKYRIIAKDAVEGRSSDHVNFGVNVQNGLTSEELMRLGRGQTIRVSWEYYIYGTTSYTMNGKTTELGPRGSGSYAISFDLSRSQAGLVVSNASFQ